MHKISILLLTISCFPSCAFTFVDNRSQTPDGAWFLEISGNTFASAEDVNKEYNTQMRILCPNGSTEMSRVPTKHALGKIGITGRFTCDGEESMTSKPRTIKKSDPMSVILKAKKCQENGGIWMNDDCIVDVE